MCKTLKNLLLRPSGLTHCALGKWGTGSNDPLSVGSSVHYPLSFSYSTIRTLLIIQTLTKHLSILHNHTGGCSHSKCVSTQQVTNILSYTYTRKRPYHYHLSPGIILPIPPPLQQRFCLNFTIHNRHYPFHLSPGIIPLQHFYRNILPYTV